MIVHGIPGDYRAKEGDIISFDVGVTKDGLIADSAATFAVGEISAEAQRLLDVCQAALEAGIEAARVGANGRTTSRQPSRSTTEEAGFSVVRSLVGHGVGRFYHEDPQVPNFVTSYAGPELREGMTIAIEPMITAGGPDIYVHDDEWSISTVGRLARGPFRAHGGDLRGRARACSRDARRSWYHDASAAQSRGFLCPKVELREGKDGE